MTIAFVFPGQGSQSVGMLSALARLSPVVEATFAEASQVLGFDLWALCQTGPAEALNQTEVTQPAMLAAGVATYRLWRERGGRLPVMMAGHSLGEFSALVAGGRLDYKAAVALVRFRAEAMQAAVPPGAGAMAAILGMEDTDVEAACQEAAHDAGHDAAHDAARDATHESARDATPADVVEPVNFNAPGQVVIAGAAAAVARAIAVALANGAKRAIPLPISVPAHSSLMLPAAERLRERLAAVSFSPPGPVAIYGVDIKRHEGADAVRAALVKQLHTPVYWAATVRTLIAAGATEIIECGPGKVLTALNRRVDRSKELTMLALDDAKSFDEALASVNR
jgi:[acyl-carrier-protein] S-malonyltransferase